MFLLHTARGSVSIVSERVTYAEAAAILGCHFSNVAKLIRKGHLSSTRRRDGALLRADVEALALRRQQQRAKPRQGPTLRGVDHRPDTKHKWLTAPQVAALVGLTSQAITKRIRRGTMPGVMNRGRI